MNPTGPGAANGADVFFILTGAILVFAMHSGFAFLEVGTVRHKNQVNALVKILADFAVSTVAYFFVGYGIAYGIHFFASAATLSGNDGGSFAPQGRDLVKFFFLLTFAAIWPIILNTAAGVRQLNLRWLMLAKSLSATRSEVLFRIVLPGILGHILTGVRLAIGIIWIVLVPCEMLGVSSGLGYFILDTRDRLAYSELMAAIVLIGALGFLLDALAQRLHRHWVPAGTD